MTAATLRKEETLGLGVAVALHAALVAVLLLQPAPGNPPKMPERMTVSLAEDVGLTAQAPEPVAESRASITPTLAEQSSPPLPVARMSRVRLPRWPCRSRQQAVPWSNWSARAMAERTRAPAPAPVPRPSDGAAPPAAPALPPTPAAPPSPPVPAVPASPPAPAAPPLPLVPAPAFPPAPAAPPTPATPACPAPASPPWAPPEPAEPPLPPGAPACPEPPDPASPA